MKPVRDRLIQTVPLYFLFFCSGFSGLIYQVVWVREFGNVFGNTVYSASLVVAVFMLGLGVGSYVTGPWADRRYDTRPDSLLRAYGYVELIIGVAGLGISVLLPHLDRISAAVSAYSREPSGWYVLSTASYLARVAIALVLLTPIALLMGGTLTLLIRHLVQKDLDIGGWRIAVLYAVNTLGAAAGALLTDFALVPAFGLFGAQMSAVFFNIIAGAGALYLARHVRQKVRHKVRLPPSLEASADRRSLGGGGQADRKGAIAPISLALAMSGFAAMGMEIVWFRHFTILLGGFRAVFSLLLTIILIGIGAGSLVSGFLSRRTDRPVHWLIVIQGLFVAVTLLGLGWSDSRPIEQVVVSGPAYQVLMGHAGDAVVAVQSEWTRTLSGLWFNVKPMLLEIGFPALLMGFGFPLGNAVIQRAEHAVGRRAGVLYLANTVGAVCGSLAAGFLLLPALGIQRSASMLMMTALAAVVPLSLADLSSRRARASVLIGSLLIGGVALGGWVTLPSDFVIDRALARSGNNERRLTMREGLTEVVEVTEIPGVGRKLLTNGHPMSSTTRLSQRYMRALAHVPLLAIDNPEAALVIGFGVGNTTHAAALHPSMRRIEVADLSRDILSSSSFFSDVNGDVLRDPRVAVYVNDGRQHLQMRPAASYDLITLEPPPIGYAGVAALYSKEFYALAREHLKPHGYVSQWLPAYQVPAATTLAMIRAFIDVFPQAVLISGAEAELLLLGVNDARIDVDPARLAAALSRAPVVQSDMARVDLGSVREIVGTFVGSAQTLATATRDAAPVTDDRPVQEYGVRSLLDFGEAVPPSVVDLSQVAAWCPTCLVNRKPVPLVDGLDTYLDLLGRAYAASPAEIAGARRLAESRHRLVLGSAYLGAIVPESADVHNVLGISLAEKGRFDEAIGEFREAQRLAPDSAATQWHLGAALASRGAREEALDHLRRSVQLDPNNLQARHDLDVVLGLDRRR